MAYSPTGLGGIGLARAAARGRNEPVDIAGGKGHDAAAGNRRQTRAGSTTFIAQVRASLPVAPNFMAAMKRMFGTSGRDCSARSSSRSARRVSTPHPFSWAIAPASEKRATPMTRRVTPAASEARLAMRARVGPILPAAPRTRRSPSDPAHGLDDGRCGRAQKVFERRLGLGAVGGGGHPFAFIAKEQKNNAAKVETDGATCAAR